jgi:hypothetical protein
MVSTDGILGKEAKTLLKKLSEVCQYVNTHMSIAIVRATHLWL